MRVNVEYGWQTVGSVQAEAGILRFPEAPNLPGIYRFDLGGNVYIGEADLLRRRFQHYRTPGLQQLTNLRLREVMLKLLADGQAVQVWTITSASAEVDGERHALDLREKCCRLLVENAALTAAKLAGEPVENL